jgi:hypothetical protein
MTNNDDLLMRLESTGGDKGFPWTTMQEAATRIRELEVELALYKGFHDGVCKTGTHVIVPNDVRQWPFYPIEMPYAKGGGGPAVIGEDAVGMVYEVWDRLYQTHGSFDKLPDAINAAMIKTAQEQYND